jgi:hypothetical protein
MIGKNREMNQVAPRPQSIAIVAIATLGSLALAYLLWGFVSFSAISMHDMFGDVALPMFTDKLIQNRILFWLLPAFSLGGGVVMLATGKHSIPNLLVYISALVFLALSAITFTIVALAIPLMPLIGNKIGS